MHIASRDRPTKLSETHIEFITSRETIESQRGMTLKERCSYFMREFPNRKLSCAKLAKIYNSFLIRKKKIKRTKIVNQRQRRRLNRQISEARSEL